CKPEQQLERAMKRQGLSREEASARIERQLPIEDKLREADFAIDTSGTKESTLEQTREVFRALRSLTS
ncbi:MAG: dephospho-CoA kinase, partial [Bryobacteraceae bacterium]